jgi:hypothetical protein
MSQQTAESVDPSSAAAAAAATAGSAAAAGAGGAMLFSPPPPRFTPSASSTSAAAAAAPKRASVLLVHAGCYALDHSFVRITNDDSLLFRTPRRLLSLNGQLLKPFTAPYDQKHGQNTKAQTGASQRGCGCHRLRLEHRLTVTLLLSCLASCLLSCLLVGDFVVSEFTLVLLHLLSALHDQQLEHHHGMPLVVTMLTRTALSEEVKQRISPGAGAAASSAAAASARTSRSKAGQQLRFTAERASPILLRWCDSWSDATCGSNPPCVVYLPTLFWLLRVCFLDQAGAVLDTMLKEINASLWPPKSWEELVENKDQVFSKFNKYMQPARWASLRSPSCNTVAKLAEDLLYFCRVRGDGRYFVKASRTCDADCAKRITVADGKCLELLSLLTAWAGGLHQHCFGIQPFVPGFGDFELRTWLVPDHDTKRWRQVLTSRPSWA